MSGLDSKKTYLCIGASSDVCTEYIGHLVKNNPAGITVLAHSFSRQGRFDELKRSYPEVRITDLRADLSDPGQVGAMIENIRSGGYDIDNFLFFPALKFEYMRLKELDLQRVERSFAVQAESFLLLAKEFFPLMKKRENARALVMLTSYVADDMPPKFMTDYVVAKYALLGAMKAAAAEYGGGNLMINGISPEMMDTSFLDKLDPKVREMSLYKNGKLLVPSDLFETMDEMLSADFKENGTNRKICIS
ncbi:MAG: SDR family oxidoreductase [Lachnospiraceae bacterium]|nr:SDR family oxidoreductase [Lachnospiraceae bacterium]